MNNKNYKKYIPGMIGTAIYAVVVAVTLMGENAKNLDLYKFIGLSMALPIIVALIGGLIAGSITKNFKNNMINILFSTVLLSVITIIFTLLTNNMVGMDVLMENTKSVENISLSIKSNMTIGSAVQPIMLILVFSALGNFLGGKLPRLMSKIRN